MKCSIATLCVAVGLPCAAAPGAIFFTFQDPGPEREVTIQENEDSSLSFMYSFVDTVALSLTSDAGEIADTTFSETRLTFNLQSSTTPVVDQPGLLVTELSGQFTFEDVSGGGAVTILTGDFSDAVATLLLGSFMGTIEGSGSLAGDTAVGSVQLTAGAALQGLLDPGESLGGRQTSSFAFSELTGEEDDGLMTLLGSAAFTGSSQVIPAPGGAALLGLGLLSAARRRR